MKYFVTIGEITHEVLIDGEMVEFDGERSRAHVEAVAASPALLVVIGDAVHPVIARKRERRGEYELSVNGYRLAVEALDERARAIRDLSGKSGKSIGPAHLSAPMPGLIVRVNVAEGDQVRAGQGLVVMEAMKMENELRGTAAGVVRKVLVQPGNTVEKGAVLLEME